MSRASGPSPLDPGEDARIVERCLAGDRRAWDQLVSRHQRLVYAVARSYRLSDPDMADVFQDVFAALVRGLPRIRDPRTLVRWLSSTTERIARATALRRRREQALAESDPAALDSVPSGWPEVGLDMEVLEEQAMIRLALGELPEPCRRLLTALYYSDPAPDYAAAARQLGMPIGSLGPTRGRCIERLKTILARLAGPQIGISEANPTTSGRGVPPRGTRVPAPPQSPGAPDVEKSR